MKENAQLWAKLSQTPQHVSVGLLSEIPIPPEREAFQGFGQIRRCFISLSISGNIGNDCQLATNANACCVANGFVIDINRVATLLAYSVHFRMSIGCWSWGQESPTRVFSRASGDLYGVFISWRSKGEG